MKETELAQKIITWLQSFGWEIYQEVQIQTHGRRADIVAVMGPRLWVIETKLSLGLGVMAQAHYWIGYANFVSVCVPYAHKTSTRVFAECVLKKYGIGLIEVTAERIYQPIAPSLARRISNWLRISLSPEHKTFAPAGNAESLYYTPYQQTCSFVLRTVTNNPGVTVRELVDAIDHHYASDVTAKSSLLHWGKSGYIRGVEVRYDGHPQRYRFYPIGVK